MKKQIKNYSIACRAGRDAATTMLAGGGTVPELVRQIRAASVDETGFGAGFLFALSERLNDPETVSE
jgi:hypothetical protein